MFLCAVIQRVEDNCVNVLDVNGLLFCFGCNRMIGHRLDGESGVLVIANVRAVLFLPQRINTDNDRVVILTSHHEVNEIDEMVLERNVNRQRNNSHAIVLPSRRMEQRNVALVLPHQRVEQPDLAIALPVPDEIIDLTDTTNDIIDISDTLSVVSLSHRNDSANVSSINNRGETEMPPPSVGALSNVSSECANDFSGAFSIKDRSESEMPLYPFGDVEYNGLWSPDYENVSILGDSAPDDPIEAHDIHEDLDEILANINSVVGLNGNEPFRFLGDFFFFKHDSVVNVFN